MYTMVLLAAMTTGGESADIGRRGGGCGGGGLFGGGLFGGRRGGGGCYGGGWGGGCYGSGWGGGCYGGGWGHGGYAYGGGCTGGGVMMGGPMYSGGCTGGGGIIIIGGGGGTGGGGVEAQLSADEKKWLDEMLAAEKEAEVRDALRRDFMAANAAGRKAIFDKFKKRGTGGGDGDGDGNGQQVRATNQAATIVVSAPASANLTFNGQSVGASTATRRTFTTPELRPGHAYAYDVRAEYEQDGRTITVSQRVNVEPGKTVNVNLAAPNSITRR